MRWRNLVWQHGKASRDKRATDLRPKIAAQRAPAGRAEARTIAGQERFGGYDNSGYLAFLDIGSKYVEVGNLPPYGPQLLQGLSWSRIGNAMRDPSSTIAQCVDASASYPAAAILKVTGNQPAALCTPAIKERRPSWDNRPGPPISEAVRWRGHLAVTSAAGVTGCVTTEKYGRNPAVGHMPCRNTERPG